MKIKHIALLLLTLLAPLPVMSQVVANETLIYHAYDNTFTNGSASAFSQTREQLLLKGYNALNNTVVDNAAPNAYDDGMYRDYKGLAYNQDNGAFYSIFNNAAPPGAVTAQQILNFANGAKIATFSGVLNGVDMGNPGGYELTDNWVGLNYHDGTWFGLYNDKSGLAFGSANKQVVVQLGITNPGSNGLVTSYTKLFNLAGSLLDGYTTDFLDIDYYQGEWYGLYNDSTNAHQPVGGWVAYPDAARQVILNLGTSGTGAAYASNVGFLHDPILNDGIGNFEDDSHGFSMVYAPVPEPSAALMILSVGVAGLFRRNRRK